MGRDPWVRSAHSRLLWWLALRGKLPGIYLEAVRDLLSGPFRAWSFLSFDSQGVALGWLVQGLRPTRRRHESASRRFQIDQIPNTTLGWLVSGLRPSESAQTEVPHSL